MMRRKTQGFWLLVDRSGVGAIAILKFKHGPINGEEARWRVGGSFEFQHNISINSGEESSERCLCPRNLVRHKYLRHPTED